MICFDGSHFALAQSHLHLNLAAKSAIQLGILAHTVHFSPNFLNKSNFLNISKSNNFLSNSLSSISLSLSTFSTFSSLQQHTGAIGTGAQMTGAGVHKTGAGAQACGAGITNFCTHEHGFGGANKTFVA